ncbi:MAG: DUF1579 domain-containing protein [Bdellovibrionales bacterium]
MKKLILGTAVLFTAVAFAADPTTTTANTPPQWMKYTTPAEGHKAVKDLTGKFNYTMKWWASATATPELSKGTSRNKWVLGDRYLQQEVKGTAMGQPFNGIGFLAFDNFRGEYQSIWMDDMSTSILNTSGKMDPATKAITQTGTASDPMKGDKNAWFRTELKLIGKNEHIYEMYSKGTDGKEFKSMEINYKRAQ